MVSGSLTNPIVGQTSPDEPLLKGVDLSRLHVAKAQKMTLPDWARVVIPNAPDVPLLYSGLREGLPTAVFAFDLRQSDLPLQVAWPILVSNLAGELLGIDSTAADDPIRPATPVELPLRDPAWSRAPRHAAGRIGDRADSGRHRRLVGDLREHHAARRLPRGGDARPERIAIAIAPARIDARRAPDEPGSPMRQPGAFGSPASRPASTGPGPPGALRGRPVRRRRSRTSRPATARG